MASAVAVNIPDKELRDAPKAKLLEVAEAVEILCVALALGVVPVAETLFSISVIDAALL
tara:strand:+ start:1915 stop:2091 length:177 start_codon:yes stop_codon:yes gene_type:complete